MTATCSAPPCNSPPGSAPLQAQRDSGFETIRDTSRGLGLPFQDLGIIELKGFENGVRVFSIPWAQPRDSG